MTYRLLPFTLALAIAALASGCSDDVNPGSGTVRIRLTDAPAAVEHVNLVVREVAIHRAAIADTNSGWEVLDADSASFDLVELQNGVFTDLAVATVPSGTYNQIRLKLGAGSTIVVDGVTHPLEVPSGLQSGLKLIGDFNVPAGTTTELLLDFDAERSIVLTGSGTYILKPVVRIVPASLAGSIRGAVSPDTVETRVVALAGIDTLVTTVAESDGDFVLAALPSGVYVVRFDPEPGWRDTTLTGVTVTAGATTDVGTVVVTQE